MSKASSAYSYDTGMTGPNRKTEQRAYVEGRPALDAASQQTQDSKGDDCVLGHRI